MQAEHWIALGIGCFTIIGGFAGVGLLLRSLHNDTRQFLVTKIESSNQLLEVKIGASEEVIATKLEIVELKFNHLDKRLESIEEKMKYLTQSNADLSHAMMNLLNKHTR
jgi:hypothetical protein